MMSTRCSLYKDWIVGQTIQGSAATPDSHYSTDLRTDRLKINEKLIIAAINVISNGGGPLNVTLDHTQLISCFVDPVDTFLCSLNTYSNLVIEVM